MGGGWNCILERQRRGGVASSLLEGVPTVGVQELLALGPQGVLVDVRGN